MPSHEVDYCVIGQGIAGTTFAWTAHLSGKSVLILDAGTPSTASRIAAGLMTPITGPKLAKTWMWDKCRTSAEAFYRTVEKRLGNKLFYPLPALHLFRSDAERERFQKRMQSSEYQQLARPLESPEFPSPLLAPHGGFEMPTAARLNVRDYLVSTRKEFEQQCRFMETNVDCQSSLHFTASGVDLPQQGIQARQIVFCLGFQNHVDPWFSSVRFQPAKGEILSLEIPQLASTHSIHAGIWLAPMEDQSCRIGSTFEWKQLDNLPTEAAREKLLAQLQEWCPAPFNVTNQQAAVRPTMLDFKPVIGRHPEHATLAIMNGLGTKGALMAPWLAVTLFDHLEHGSPLPEELDVKRWFQ